MFRSDVAAIHPSVRPRSSRGFRFAHLACVVLFLFMAQGVGGIVDITVTDDLVSELVTRPDATDPGPVFFNNTDGLVFETGLTNVATLWYAEIASARNNSSAEGATIQGDVETFSDWFYGKQDEATKYASFNATGTYDADGGAYVVPMLFTKSSQGTLTIRSYAAAAPANGGMERTYHWAYDAGKNRYVIGATKDLSGEAQIAPVSDPLGGRYVRDLESNKFVVHSAGAAPDHVPTVMQGVHLPLLSLPGAVTWYVLMDTPAGVHEDSYSFELQVTALGL